MRFLFFFQAEDGIRDSSVTGVQTCALPICVFEQWELDQLAEYANVPVINALSDRFHPCQAYADFFTLRERFGTPRGLKLAYVGDGNNVCHSLMATAARVGAKLRIATPAGYEPDASIVAERRQAAGETRAPFELFHSPG